MSSSPEMIEDEFTFAPSSEEDSDDEESIFLENEYYQIKKIKKLDAVRALELLEELISKQSKLSLWGLKCLKQILKINVLILRRPSEFLNAFRRLKDYIGQCVSITVTQNTLDRVFEYCREMCSSDLSFKNELYEVSIEICTDRPTLVFILISKFAFWASVRGDEDECLKWTELMRKACGEDMSIRDSDLCPHDKELLAALALEISIFTKRQDFQRTLIAYKQAQFFDISHASVSVAATILECGAMISCEPTGSNLTLACNQFLRACQFYQESPSFTDEASRCFKYAIACHMLSPANSSETAIKMFNVPVMRMFAEDVPLWVSCAQSIRDRNYAAAIDLLKTIEIPNNQSQYRLLRKLKGRIVEYCRKMMLVKSLEPFMAVNLDKIANLSKGYIEQSQILDLIRNAIMHGDLRGKVDVVNGIFVRNGCAHLYRRQ